MSRAVANITVYKPPTVVPEDVFHEHHTIFLAGSIEMGRAQDWQAAIALELEAFSERAVLLNPRRDDWDSSWEQRRENATFHEQVTWEMDMLERCDTIFFYFAPGTKSPISLLELGLHAASGKVLVCCPEGFWRKGNVDIVCERFGIPCVEDFDQGVARLAERLKP